MNAITKRYPTKADGHRDASRLRCFGETAKASLLAKFHAMKPLNKGSGALADLARQALERILEVLPETGGIDWSRHWAARWRSGPVAGTLAPLGHLDQIELTDLLGVDDQKAQLVANTEQFLRGFPANNALLWGARGTGKSSLVHAVLNRYAPDGLRLVEVDKEALRDVATIVAYLDNEPYRFVLVCDDLSFEADDASYKALKSALEGSVFTQSENVLIYATSNRRHLLPEHMSDNTRARHVDGELHEAEAVEEENLAVGSFRPLALLLPFSPGRLPACGAALVRTPWGGRGRRRRLGRKHPPRRTALGTGAGVYGAGGQLSTSRANG